jgi:hypothetical protein
MRERIYRADGYRLCSYCGRNWIGQCMGSVVAGDLLLAFAGQLPMATVRERCGACMMRNAANRDGNNGPYVWLAAQVYDLCRLISWRLQRRFRRVRFDPLLIDDGTVMYLDHTEEVHAP